MEINIIEILLSYHKTLLDLTILDSKITRPIEITTCLLSSCKDEKSCNNIYGNTRCFTTTDVLLDNILFVTKTNIIKIDNIRSNNSLKLSLYLNIITHNLVKIAIVPDHIFYIYKIDNNWYLFSSWIYFYNFNINKIENIEEFLDFLDIYFVQNNKTDHNRYQYLLQKYFFYKFTVDQNSIYINKELKTLYYSLNTLNTLNRIGTNFIVNDYFGDIEKHEITFEFYKIDNDNIITTFSQFINTTFVKYFNTPASKPANDKSFRIIKEYLEEPKYDNAINNIIINIKNKVGKNTDNIEYHKIINSAADILKNLDDIVKIISPPNRCIIKEPTVNNDMSYIDDITKYYGQKILNLIKANKYNFGFLTGGYDVRKLFGEDMVNIVNNNSSMNAIYFNNYNLITRNSKLYDIIIKNKTLTNTFNYTDFDRFCNSTMLTRLKKNNILVKIDQRTFIIMMNVVQLTNNNNYNTIQIISENDNDNKYVQIDCDIKYVADNIFTNYKLYNHNLYISNYDKISTVINVYNIDMISAENKKIKNIVEKRREELIGMKEYSNNINTFLLDLYAYNHDFTDPNKFIYINELLSYYNYYSKLINKKSKYTYIPFLVNDNFREILLKNIYISFVKYNYKYNKFLSYISKILTDAPPLINKRKVIVSPVIKDLHNKATNGFIQTIFSTDQDNIKKKINFLLITYNIIKEHLNNKGYEEMTHYILVFKGGMALNLLILMDYIKFCSIFTESDFDYSIHINTDILNANDIIQFKLELVNIICLIKNKLNLNISESKYENIYADSSNSKSIAYKIKDEMGVYLNKLVRFVDDNNGKIIEMNNETNFNIKLKEEKDILINQPNNITFKNYIIPNYFYLSYNHYLNFTKTKPLLNSKFDLIRIKLNFELSDLKNTHVDGKKRDKINIKSEVIDISIIEESFTPEFIKNFNNKNTYNSIYTNFIKSENILLGETPPAKLPDTAPEAQESLTKSTDPQVVAQATDVTLLPSSLVLLRHESEIVVKSTRDNPIIFYTIEYFIIDLFYMVLLEYIFPWLGQKYEKRIIRFLTLIFIYDNKLINKLSQALLGLDSNDEKYDISQIDIIGKDEFFKFATDINPCDYHNINNLVDCFIDRLYIFKKIYNSEEIVYDYIYNLYLTTVISIKLNYTFIEWKTNFCSFISKIKDSINLIKQKCV